MTDTPHRELSSAFDDMLAHSRKRFDDLYHSGRSKVGGAATVSQSTVSAPARSISESTTTSIVLDPASSPAIRRLKERFGNDWRYEIVDQQRNGDEAIVLCRLTFGKQDVVRSQFGRSKLPSRSVGGTSGSLHFTLGMDDGAKDVGDAFRRAAEAALMNCLDLV
jgi:hypothetical protein